MSDRNSRSVATTSEHRPRRWDPATVFSEIEAEMDRVFGRRLPFMQPLRRYMGANISDEWVPSADVYEKDGDLVVKAELPGVARDDIDVMIDNGDLVIKGERRSEEEVEEANYFRMERFSGTFYRRFPLPDNVDEDQIRAEYRDGVLEIQIPKPT
ncbi:MAG TPA: Hsp20/alpha crystallin family protein, partial [Thermomicrobiales bacterium]|nr:Hsp20/alpha crystallin family protein [Thermomicrobiales bacterium]